MPADSSKAAAAAAAARRRNNLRRDAEDIKYDSNHAREIELKRSRGEISCAECRRLKIRCDKTIPCQSCQRRGCAALCPNGSLATGQGTRFVLAATEHLHRRIAKMSERIHQLEDALAIMQAKGSNEPHPLLSDDSSKGKSMDDDDDILVPDQSVASSGDVVTAFGMLSMSDRGVSRFFGPTGGTEYLLFSDSDAPSSPSNGSRSPESLRSSKTPPLPGEITRFSNAFPFTPMGPPHHVYEMIEGHLPPYPRACELAESYVNHAAWLFRSVPRSQLFDEMLPRYYKQAAGDDAPLPRMDQSNPHDLALLLLCFAIGALMDLKLQPYNSEGEHYCQLAQAAMCLQPILANPTLVTIQALHLQSIYVAMVGNEPGGQDNQMELSWALVTLAGQLSHTIGLHRDSARFGFSPEIVERRRVTFWDLFVADAWQSLMTGRPPVIQREYIDCKFPTPVAAPNDDDGGEEREAAFETWGFRFALNCVAEVASKTLTAEAPSYETVMELDRKVREFPIPADAAALQEDLEMPPDSEPPPLQESMIRFVLAHSREVILLFLHRSFFAQAIIDCPRNPLRSTYAPSFLAAYRSSSTVLKVVRDQFNMYPTVCARFWVIWTFAFSAAVVFATVVTRGPRSAMAPQALTQLDQAYELFTQASKHSRRAAKALPILQRLREKAHCAFTAAQNESAGNAMYEGALWNIKTEKDEDELDIFAGRTAVVASKRPSPSPSTHLPPIQQSGDGLPLITPPSTIPIAPINAGAGGPNGVALTDAWPSVHPQSSTSNPGHSHSHSHVGPGQYSSQSGPPTLPALHAPQQPYRLSFSQPAQPPPPQSHSSYQWVPGHSHSHSHSHSGHAQSYSGPGGQHFASQQPSFGGADILQRYSGPSTGYPPQHQQQQQQQQGGQPYAPPSELVSLGLASRHGRLDERWTSFMHENGFL
ncbi:transcription factor [Ganoderma sinense ZZ0214-1]|uniref:Transcription factor n=1 Tax=Ganoderma sinense ZZ0214-1 TaxID=1077348 RepID=A0A2G8RTJ7_9APHY|nr:transcription factor [Ganoderma sinense ZZ0214-1]